MSDDYEDTGLSTLPMDLQMFAFSLNKLMSKLLFVRMDRTKIMAETAQALIDDDAEAAQRQLEKMHSAQTIAQEWRKMAEIKDEIAQTMADNMHLFEAADKDLKKAGKAGVNFADLQLPAKKLAEAQAKSATDTAYDCMQEYNELLNDFLSKTVELCGELSMSLIKI